MIQEGVEIMAAGQRALLINMPLDGTEGYPAPLRLTSICGLAFMTGITGKVKMVKRRFLLWILGNYDAR
jgi:hypothetical protein